MRAGVKSEGLGLFPEKLKHLQMHTYKFSIKWTLSKS